MKIGVFDSGIGGVTVLNELRTRFSAHDYFYLGDTANVPYGTKSPSQIRQLARAAAERVRTESVDALVVACNTASCLAIEDIRAVMGTTPVFGVVEAGVATVVQALKKSAPHSPVLVLGTRATIRSHVYATLLAGEVGDKINVIEQSCPLLVPMIEEGWTDHPILHQTVAEYVRPHIESHPGIALLACTHYPWITAAFRRALPEWTIVDSAFAMAETLGRGLPGIRTKSAGQGKLDWVFTDPDSVPKGILAGI